MKASGLGDNVKRRWWLSGQPHSGSSAETSTVGHRHTKHTQAPVPPLKMTRPSKSERWSGSARGWWWDFWGSWGERRMGRMKWKIGSQRPGWREWARGDLPSASVLRYPGYLLPVTFFKRRIVRILFRIINLVEYRNAFNFYSWTYPQMFNRFNLL